MYASIYMENVKIKNSFQFGTINWLYYWNWEGTLMWL